MGTGRPQGMSEATAGTYTALFPSSSFFRIVPLHHVIGFKYIFPIILFKTHFDALDLLVVFLRSQLSLVVPFLSCPSILSFPHRSLPQNFQTSLAASSAEILSAVQSTFLSRRTGMSKKARTRALSGVKGRGPGAVPGEGEIGIPM